MDRIAKAAALAVLSILCTGARAQGAERGYAPPGYTLVWEDDFNGSELDLDRWFYRDGISRGRVLMPKENVRLRDGALELHCTVEKTRVKPGQYRIHGEYEPKDEYDLGGAGIISDWRFSDGYFEARSLMVKASFWHPAFWLERAHADGDNSLLMFDNRSEIDILECEPQRSTEQSIRIHDWVTGGEHRKLPPQGMTKASDQRAGWFVWGMKLTRAQADFYENGKLVSSVKIPENWVRDPRNIILSSLTIGDPTEGGVQRFDWVRYYEPDSLRQSLVKDCELLRYETSLLGKNFVEARDKNASGGIYQVANNARLGDHVRYMVHVPAAGDYGVRLNSFTPKGDTGKWQLLIDGKPQGHAISGTSSDLGNATFSRPGDYEFKFKCIDSPGDSSSFGFDSIELVK